MGKDQGDQETAVEIHYINSYVHAGHNLLPADVKKVLYI